MSNIVTLFFARLTSAIPSDIVGNVIPSNKLGIRR